ncbi:RagB/SusD family nutrient uptake outer membrane protein [Salinimicrobium xinjiangense]|uniref:RagB/SusD family nutrient uptake outer membrane protein n=1 Tax=Salinimicrobium xinjiangense TaxID=438596 RepID=UPI0003FBCE8A|nr:RagB/SusD family nutrient uptake outer membrane protein [Salinimicrobium xinjiangense]
MYNKVKSFFLIFLSLTILGACESELDLTPEDNREGPDQIFQDAEAYKQFLAKLYAGLAVSGQQGPAGNPDLIGLDEGFSQYLRLYWMLQELPTEEAVIGWNDGTILTLHGHTWTSGNEFIRTMYSRILYQVAQTNAFIRQTSDAELDAFGIDQAKREEIKVFRAEARFLRALSYYHALDLFGNPPFITKDDPVGAFLPEQINRADLFLHIEKELNEIVDELAPAPHAEYGRADQAAAWTLLAKLYLNNEVFLKDKSSAVADPNEFKTSQQYFELAVTNSEKVINAGYALTEDYQDLFLADNHRPEVRKEIIFPIRFDGLNTRSFGGMTFLIRAAIGGDMDPAEFGVNSGWGGLRTTPEFVNLFPGGADSEDEREMFFTDGQSLEINDITRFNDGYAVAKFRNVTSEGVAGSDPTGEHPDTDFPLFRLADVYLMYAEAVLRGGGGSQAQAVTYINDLRERAYGDDSGDISSNELNLNFILAERGRELYWEAHRRTDLVRFGQFTTQGIWAWKGNVPQGTTTAGFRDIYPIPASDLGVNTKLTQNPGY